MNKIIAILTVFGGQALAMGVLTWVFSFGYQLFFYWYYAHYSPGVITHYSTVFSYYSGIIGDGLLIPLLNFLVFLFLKRLGTSANTNRASLAITLGLLLTIVAYTTQATLALTNWSMPEPFHWSAVGRFHFFFMWSESSFLIYVLIEAIRSYKQLLADKIVLGIFGLAILDLLAFGATFLADYLKILGL